MKVGIVLGTRPEIIKMSPLIRALEARKVDFFLVHSNQHYSENMDKVFFKELKLPSPRYNLGIGSAEHGNQTGRMLIAMEEIFLKEKPQIVLAQGDTNTVLAGILAASKQNIKTGHVEAGLRSYDRRMPEEKNRILCDSISDMLFCPTKTQEAILLGEGISRDKIFVVGNTVVDAALENIRIAEQKSEILEELRIKAGEYVLFTAHRDLNVDYKDSLKKVLRLISLTHEKTKLPIVFPMHPRTAKKVKEFELEVKDAMVIDPLGYLDFLVLQKSAYLIVTDSGGVQEEACTFNVPCITIRENTERPETVDVGANKIVSLDESKLTKAIEFFKNNGNKWINPLGQGSTGKEIMELILKKEV